MESGSWLLNRVDVKYRVINLVYSYESKSGSVSEHFDKLSNMTNHFLNFLNISDEVPVSLTTT